MASSGCGAAATTLILSLILSSIAVLLYAVVLSRNVISSLLGMVILFCSKAFVDYSTSGLENPLSFVLMVLFYYYFLHKEIFFKNLLILSILASLSALNRQDTLLLFLFPLGYALIQYRKMDAIWALLIGFSPLILWELFSLIYYGFPFPNTYHAKLNTGIDPSAILLQGYYYYLNSLEWDPITLLVIGNGVVLSWVKRDRKLILVSLGIVSYLLYILHIGGDFMSGRFFASPLLLAVILLSQIVKDYPVKGLVWVLILPLFSLYLYRSPLKIDFAYKEERFYNGIADERGFYYSKQGLFHITEDIKEIGDNFTLIEDRWVLHASAYGRTSFLSPDHLYFIDIYALTDPLLSKLNCLPQSRIGHFERKLPIGYLASLVEQENHLIHPSLSLYYDQLSLLVHDRIFSLNRLKEIWKVNLGVYDDFIREYEQDTNDLVRMEGLSSANCISTPNSITCLLNLTLMSDGIYIDLKETIDFKRIDILIEDPIPLQLVLIHQDKGIYQQRLVPEDAVTVEEGDAYYHINIEQQEGLSYDAIYLKADLDVDFFTIKRLTILK